MKILMVSIFAPHFFNWTEQLKGSGHEIYWLDVFDSKTKVEKIDFVHQITDWRYKWDFPGRYFLKEHFPLLTSFINRFNENRFQKFFEDTVNEVQPDLIHSFIMQSSSYPIYNFMNKNPGIKWLYSSWGSDIYYYYKKDIEVDKMTKVFSRLDYLFTDCYRDYQIARKLGFKGKFLGAFPGGGGLDFKTINSFIKPFSQRNTILIKGYQGKHGRCLEVLKAMSELRQKLNNYEIVIFGAAEEVFKYIENSEFKNWSNIQCYGQLPHSEIIKLMGEALIYIGNSNSDGMPNTLLEAIIMGAFPIQSNPGGATAELVENGKNGLLIHNSEDTEEIQHILSSALDNIQEFQPAVKFNLSYLKPKLEKGYISEKVLESYALIDKDL